MREIVGQVTIPRDVDEVRGELQDWLVDHEIHSDHEGSVLIFEPPIFLFNWSLFAGISKGRIRIEKTGSGCVVHYEIALGYLRFFAVCVTLISAVVAWFDQDLKFLLIGLAVGWIWIYGLSYLMARSRLGRFFSSLPDKPYVMNVHG